MTYIPDDVTVLISKTFDDSFKIGSRHDQKV